MTADNNVTATLPTTSICNNNNNNNPPAKSCNDQEEEIPGCYVYQNDVALVKPDRRTPRHSLYLSNLDDQKFLRFSIKYIYLYYKAVGAEALKSSLSAVLSDYYPLAGRVRAVRSPSEDLDDDNTDILKRHDDDDDDHHDVNVNGHDKLDDDEQSKLVVDCNGEGAVFAVAFMDYTAKEFLAISEKPNKSWRKLLYRVEGARSFLDVPPLLVQATYLRCGGMILCTAINHCLCDGMGTSQFLNAWAHVTTTMTNKPSRNPTPPVVHSRHLLKPRSPRQVTSTHPQFTKTTPPKYDENIVQYLHSHPLVPTSTTFTPSQILMLKRQCTPSVKCTAFEVLAAHTWRSWVKSLAAGGHLIISSSAHVIKLLFSINVRKRLKLPDGYYGNGFVLGCAEANDLIVDDNLHHAVKLVQSAKSAVTEGYVRSMVDLMEEDRRRARLVRTVDLSASLVISQWSRLGLEDLDFGKGKPLHMGPLTSDVYCLFLPVIGDPDSVRVSVSMPESVAATFERYMTDFLA